MSSRKLFLQLPGKFPLSEAVDKVPYYLSLPLPPPSSPMRYHCIVTLTRLIILLLPNLSLYFNLSKMREMVGLPGCMSTTDPHGCQLVDTQEEVFVGCDHVSSDDENNLETMKNDGDVINGTTTTSSSSSAIPPNGTGAVRDPTIPSSSSSSSASTSGSLTIHASALLDQKKVPPSP